MLSPDIVAFCLVALSPVVLALALAWVLAGGTLRGRRAVEPADDGARIAARDDVGVDRPDISQRRELAVQLSIGLALVAVGGLVGWVYLASAVHNG